ncbi:hypothetical protein V0M98_34205 (plasmid) [Pseudomonas silesiensis]|uniref:hypothetical protein n=1 Tax=Pseudomonas silesiensis TaxID=1853130 RepID=UPI0030D47DDB
MGGLFSVISHALMAISQRTKRQRIEVYSGREKYLNAFPDYPEGWDYFRGFDCEKKSVIQRQRLELRFRKKEVLARLERELSGFSKATKESDLYGFLGRMSGLVEGGLLDRDKADELNHLAKMQVFELDVK